MIRPKLLDLFCGAGGASMGYHQAGFEVEGIDNKPQPHYPFSFLQVDALEAMGRLLRGEGLTFSNGETIYLADIDAYHASPPCQGYSATANLPWLKDKEYPLLILPTRLILQETGKPYVIENVKRARWGCKQLSTRKISEHGMDAGLLCGCMFNLPYYLERLFETNFLWWQPPHQRHNSKTAGRMFGGRLRLAQEAKLKLMPWMDRSEAREAIPPAYTEYIGKYLLQDKQNKNSLV